MFTRIRGADSSLSEKILAEPKPPNISNAPRFSCDAIFKCAGMSDGDACTGGDACIVA